MQRSFSRFLFFTVLILGLGLGEIAWMRLDGPGCRDWQTELQRRVEAYARMHLPEPAPQVQVQSVCGHPNLHDALYFRWQNLAFRMGWRQQRPLEEGDLRMAATRDLMQHPAMGTLKFVVRFDASLDVDTRKRVEELIARYLQVDNQRQKLEFKRVKKLNETAAVKGTIILPEPPTLNKPWRTPLLPNPEPPLKASLIRACNTIFAILVLSLGSFFFLPSMRWGRKIKKSSRPLQAPPLKEGGAFAVLFAPRVLRDFGDRGRSLWKLLVQLDAPRARKRALAWFEKDREGLLQFLGWVDAATQEAILSHLPTDQLLQLGDTLGNHSGSPRDSQRAALRILFDIARELAQCSRLVDAPLFIHLLTKREWQKVAQQMTRPRRRALAELLDKERASWLRARQDLHPGWFHGAQEIMVPEQLIKRVRSILQVDADQLREQLYADREAMSVIDSFFADLTLDAGLNNDLAMLVLGDCQNRQAGFVRLMERKDPNLLAALQLCDDQQVALLLYESEASFKDQVYGVLGSRRDAVESLVLSMSIDRHHSKSLRMQARSLQRFVERQVLVADLLCPQNPH